MLAWSRCLCLHVLMHNQAQHDKCTAWNMRAAQHAHDHVHAAATPTGAARQGLEPNSSGELGAFQELEEQGWNPSSLLSPSSAAGALQPVGAPARTGCRGRRVAGWGSDASGRVQRMPYSGVRSAVPNKSGGTAAGEYRVQVSVVGHTVMMCGFIHVCLACIQVLLKSQELFAQLHIDNSWWLPSPAHASRTWYTHPGHGTHVHRHRHGPISLAKVMPTHCCVCDVLALHGRWSSTWAGFTPASAG
jgi:hypothetical protein